jgi:hypothetical protein
MANYTKTTDFAAKDTLPGGDTNKVVRGAEFETEFDAISTAIATKSDTASPTFTGTVTVPTADINGGNIDGTVIGASTAAAGTFTNLTATGTVNFNGATVSNLGTITTANLDGGTVDNSVIGGATPAAGTFTDLTANTSFTSGNVDINGGAIDGAIIGANSAAAGTFSSLTATTADINGGSIDGTVIGGSSTAAISGTTGTFSGAVTGSNLNVSNWDTAYGWGDHSTQGYLTSVAFSNLDAGAVTLSSETFSDVDNQVPTNAAVIDYVAATIPLITELNDLSAVVTWATVPDAYISASSVNQHVSVEKATQSKTYTLNETSTLTLSSSITSGVPVVSVTKEIPQTGVSNNDWDVNSTTENYTRINSATATTLTPSAVGDGTFTLGTGSFTSSDVGKTIEGNGGVAILTATDGSYVTTTDFTDTSTIASGSWEMYAVVYNTTDGDLELSQAITSSYDISSATFTQSKDLIAQSGDGVGLAFKPDGTKMFVVDKADDRIYQYSLSTAFDISTATYDAVSFNTATNAGNPQSMAFNSDGTKMFVLSISTQEIEEFTLSTAYSLSSVTHVDGFSVGTQESTPTGMHFKPDGTKVFIIGEVGERVYEYGLSTAFDISTASFTGQSNSVGAKDNTPSGLTFNGDGTSFFVTGEQSDNVHEYSLTTAFSVSSAGTFVRTLTTSSKDTDMGGLTFDTDGVRLFLIGRSSNSIHEYSTGAFTSPSGYHAVHTTTSTDSTYWTDVNSMTADEAAGDGAIYYAVSTDDRTTWKIAKGTDGERSIVRNNAGTWQYNSNSTYGSETWTNATTNAELPALQEAMAEAQNQMNKTQLDAVPDANHFTLGNDLDLAIIFNLSSGTTVPSSDGVSINFDANSLNQGAILGTDYNWDFPAANKVRITSLAAQNLKVRII